jgi:Asp-tRNA(Asn)/Glu-tRNA(Gln) amidotransferase C subunit
VTPELIRKTATLSQLTLTDEEVTRLVPRFKAFLAFVDKMREVPDTGEPLPPCTQSRASPCDIQHGSRCALC